MPRIERIAPALGQSDRRVHKSGLNLLMQQQRYAEARQLVQTAVNTAPDNDQFRSLMDQLARMK